VEKYCTYYFRRLRAGTSLGGGGEAGAFAPPEFEK